MDHTTFFQGLASYDPPSDASWFENLQNGWNYVWKVFPAVSSYELDKQLLNNLRDFRAIMSGETLDVSCTLVRNRLTPPILRKLEGSSAQTSPSHGKLRNVIKSLLQLAANLSQSREFRDLFEDIITKIAEPLEESGLNVAEINTFLCACAYMEITEGGSRAMSLLKAPSEGTSTRSSLEHGTSISSFNLSNPKYASRNEHLKKDWLRFTTFTRMCLLQLVSSDRKL